MAFIIALTLIERAETQAAGLPADTRAPLYIGIAVLFGIIVGVLVSWYLRIRRK